MGCVSVVESYVFDVQLNLGTSTPAVFFEKVAEVEMVATFDSIEIFAQLEADGGVGARAGIDLDGGEFEVFYVVGTYYTREAIVYEIVGAEDGEVVAWSEGCELFEDAYEFGGDMVGEVDFGVDIYFGDHVFFLEFAVDYFFKSFDEGVEVLWADGDAGGAFVSSKMLEKVGTFFQGGMDVEFFDGACGAYQHVFGY